MLNPLGTAPVRVISTETIKPAAPSTTRRIELTPWDLAMLSLHYIQKGPLFSVSVADVKTILPRLKASLSLSLIHFFPLAGRLVTTASDEREGTFTYLDCGDQGAEFIHAVADGVTVADVLAAGKDVPHRLTRRLFAMDSAVSHDGHTGPLLAVQVTQLVDGLFLGCSFNHVVGDGTSFWHFFNAWAEIYRNFEGAEAEIVGDNSNLLIHSAQITRPPVHDKLFFDGRTTPIQMPFRHPDEFLERFRPPVELRERVFHFSPEAIASLKAEANNSKYCKDGAAIISSFQALSALLWRAITRARRFPEDQQTTCYMAAENRRRLQPRLPEDYFGNSVYAPSATATAGELLGRDLGWAALLLNRTVAAHTDRAIRDAVERWMAAPAVHHYSAFETFSVMVSSSPRFDMYGCDFGWGKAVAIRSGAANKFDGKVMAYPGRKGGGWVDMEICLVPETMAALESDQELIAVISSPPRDIVD